MSETYIESFHRVILLDIEGTTTSISFVKDILFPFVRTHLKDYLNAEWMEKELEDDIEGLRKQAEDDVANGLENTVLIPREADESDMKKAVVANVINQMDLDRKATALKQLQGHIWRKGYAEGKISGHLYDDVPIAFKRWKENNKIICIYSSGSVEAQKLLFGHSKFGDLMPFISDYFDTRIGPKIESSSYTAIAKSLKCDPSEIVFFTDVSKEAIAAKKSGLNAILVEREGNAPLNSTDRNTFSVITSFDNC